MRLVTAAFDSPQQFLHHYSSDYPNGALFCRTRADFGLREQALVEVSFPGLPNRTLLRGHILVIELGQGAWISIDPSDRTTRDFMLAIARGELEVNEPVERSHARFPAQLPVTCSIEEFDDLATDRLFAETTDVGAGGVYIESKAPPPVGTRVSLVIGPTAASQTFVIDGCVAWLNGRGFGVQFDSRGEQDSVQFRALLRHASESGRINFALS